MPHSYIILGAGRQGTAAAYDLACFGDAQRLTLADVNIARAQSAAKRVNDLVERSIADAIQLDVRDTRAVAQALHTYDVALSAVPYYFNYDLTLAALEAKTSFCDLGGNTDLVLRQHALNGQAKAAGVRIVPDCGMGPGMGNTLGVYAMQLLDTTEHVHLYDGGIPIDPQPPWNYLMSFNIEGLTNEYWGGMTILRNGELVHVPCFDENEFELVDFPPIGTLEAFMVAGGVSTAPWTFKDRLQTYQLKIVRYPGTFAQLKAFADLGLFSPDPIAVNGDQVIPRDVFHAMFEPQVHADVIKDYSLIRAHSIGTREGKAAQAIVDLVDRYDEATGFSAMERTTGWHLSIVAIMLARGETPLGSIPLELAVPGDAFVRAAKKRGFQISERIL